MAKFTITITQEELLSIVRQHFNVSNDFEIKIEDVDQNIEDQWFDVPVDWRQTTPPYPANMFNTVEVMCRDGSTWINNPHNFAMSWWQEDRADDIVRYRKVD